MVDIVAAFVQALLEGSLTHTGRWVLSVLELKSNAFAETFLGLPGMDTGDPAEYRAVRVARM